MKIRRGWPNQPEGSGTYRSRRLESVLSKQAVVQRRASKVTTVGALRLDPNTKSIDINVDHLPPPTKVYDADVAWVEHFPGDVRLFFGKYAKPNLQRFRSRVEVRYPAEAFYGHFWGHSREFHESLLNQTQPPVREGQPPRDELCQLVSDKDYSEWANFDIMAHTGTEATVEFFHLPTIALTRFIRTGKIAALEVEPAVRVQMTTSELLALLDHCRGAIESIKRHLPAGDTPNVKER